MGKKRRFLKKRMERVCEFRCEVHEGSEAKRNSASWRLCG